jgi:serine/threonine protein kinase
MQLDTILADRYRIHEQLSSKAGRQTFLAQDLQSQDLVIIKVLRFGASFQWDDLKLFEREALTLKNLAHPAIPQYLDYFELDLADLRGFALVQTYLPAPSLETVVRERRSFSEQDVIEIADRLLSIITYLHEQNPPVIHRDIKPSNILLSNRSAHNIGDVYLVDFGSVQTSANKDGGTMTIVGSYGYMPLEQFGGQTRAASDLYSLGMTLIYLLTGHHPAELIGTNGEIKFDRSNLSEQFSRWIDKMIQPHLNQRFDSAKSAKMMLKSNEEENMNFGHLKFTNNAIKLKYSKEVLEIEFYRVLFPSEQSNYFDPNKASGGILLVGWFSISVIYHAYGGIWLIITIISCLIAWVVCENIYTNCFGFRILEVNQKTKSLKKSVSHKIKRKEIRTQPVNSRPAIDLLTYYPGQEFSVLFGDQDNELKENTATTLAELSIHIGKKEYTISDSAFSPQDLYLLAQELSSFLDLPLQIIE